MFDELEFRYRQGDGRNVAIVAVLTILAIPVLTWIGEPALYAIGFGTAGFVIRHLMKR
ncbi:MAG TPA: hypothetical protein VJ652_15170 [Noviherbaspirillum sp.]|nr:hypothetical protein [Noviherbaspirillum sp.]